MEILINNKPLFLIDTDTTNAEVKCLVEKKLGLKSEEYYLVSDGKRIDNCSDLQCSRIHIILRVFGGKGGFGSMLRAIGAQIEKTTNREACRDLSGRRLRDINEEQRLKNWINQQAEREKEAKERKQKKLERLCEKPKHEFRDEQYDKERSELPEIVEDALLRGLQASCSTKRKVSEKKPVVKKKKPKLWVDDDLEDDLSSSGEDEDSDSEKNKKSCSTSKTSDSDNSNSAENTQKLNKTILDHAVKAETNCGEETNALDLENSSNSEATKTNVNDGQETKNECKDTTKDEERNTEIHKSVEQEQNEISQKKEKIRNINDEKE